MRTVHIVGDYIYDSSRLVLYRKDLGSEAVHAIEDLVPEEDENVPVVQKLSVMNPDNVSYQTIFITRAGLCLNFNCNLRCVYCSDSSREGNQSLSLNHVDIFIGEVMKRWKIRRVLDGEQGDKELYVFISGGGEPAYDEGLLKSTLRLLREKSEKTGIPINISITTNGVYDDNVRQMIAGNCNRIMVSYDGLPAIQNRNRRTAEGTTTNDVVEDSIRFFINKSPRPITIRTTIWPEDISQLRAMADYVFRRFPGNFVWSLFPVNPFGRALGQMRKCNDDVSHDFASGFVDVVNYVKRTFDSDAVETSFFDTSTNPFFCGGLSCSVKTPWLLPGGTVVACLETGGRAPFASVASGQFKLTDLKTDRLLAMMQRKLVECRNCLVYKFCKGGCPAMHISNEENGIVGLPWSCKMYIRYAEIMLKTLSAGKDFLGWRPLPISLECLSSGDAYRLVKERV